MDGLMASLAVAETVAVAEAPMLRQPRSDLLRAGFRKRVSQLRLSQCAVQKEPYVRRDRPGSRTQRYVCLASLMFATNSGVGR